MEDPGAKNEPATGRHIQPGLRRKKAAARDAAAYAEAIRSGDRAALSQAITLVESTLAEHQELAQRILEHCRPQLSDNVFRLGISGSPGVGKSTFIDTFGHYLISQGRQLAILAIDPSSPLSKGSILGDKTRMEQLARAPEVFIRPSPSGTTLGGVAQKTRESMLLCEVAGFDTIIVETVGVGQSETAVRELVDFFLLLLQPGAGDELQGIKRGIVEMADLLVVNKADGETLPLAVKTQRAYQHAVHLQPAKASGWPVQVVQCSALEGRGIANLWQLMRDFCTFTQKSGFWQRNRQDQALHWFHESLLEHLQQLFYQQHAVQLELPQIEKSIRDGLLSPFQAARQLIRLFIEAKA